MALTRKGLVYLILAYIFIGLALAFREPALTAFVIPNTLLLLFSGLKPSPKALELRVIRRISPLRSFGGENVDITVKITNNSAINIDDLSVSDRLPDSLKLESGSEKLTMHLPSGKHAELCYRLISPKRGIYVLGPLSFRTTDLIGLHEYTGEISVLDDFVVLPRMDRLGPIELRARRVGPWPGLVPSRRIGIGTEFYELRNYNAGDDLRKLNWKASAKLGHLMANEFEGENVTDVLVVLDCSEGTQSRLFDFDVAELEVTLAASLCAQLIQQGNRVGLSVYSAVRTWVDPGFGKRQLLRLLNNLAIVTPGKASLPIAYAVESVVSSIVPSKSIVVFISPLLGDAPDVVTKLASKGYRMICFTPSTGSITDDVPVSMVLARRILDAERKVGLIDVSKMARVIEISPEINVRSEMRRLEAWRRA